MTVAAANDNDTLLQKKQLVEWLRSKGGFFSNKISFQPPEVNAAAGGIYAVEEIEENELLMIIPENALLTAHVEEDWCSTAELLVSEYVKGPEASEFWPYVQYVFESYPHRELPPAWSESGKELVYSIISDYFEPQRFGQQGSCHEGSEEGDYETMLDAATRIVVSRGWHDVLVPVYDMGNHRNGRWHNMDQLHDSRTQDDFHIVALRRIEPGEQLFLSYNECNDHTCYGKEHSYLTPQLFADYGFVEQYPQRWSFWTKAGREYSEEKLLFDLDVEDTSSSTRNASTTTTPLVNSSNELRVSWISDEPDEFQLKWLDVHLKRLLGMKDFVMYEAERLEHSFEARATIDYYHALIVALQQAIRWASPSSFSLKDDDEQKQTVENTTTELEQESTSSCLDPAAQDTSMNDIHA
ncbi:hypothetical protein ACA910_006984 [Epithemia clementina (nom. ined.)]